MAAKIKIPKVKTMPSAEEIATRGGALKLVGYLESQLTIFGKIRAKNAKQKYSYDNIVAEAKADLEKCQKLMEQYAKIGGDIRNHPYLEGNYFAKESESKSININVLKDLEERLSDYMDIRNQHDEKRVNTLSKAGIIGRLSTAINILNDKIEKGNVTVKKAQDEADKIFTNIKKNYCKEVTDGAGKASYEMALAASLNDKCPLDDKTQELIYGKGRDSQGALVYPAEQAIQGISQCQDGEWLKGNGGRKLVKEARTVVGGVVKKLEEIKRRLKQADQKSHIDRLIEILNFRLDNQEKIVYELGAAYIKGEVQKIEDKLPQ